MPEGKTRKTSSNHFTWYNDLDKAQQFFDEFPGKCKLTFEKDKEGDVILGKVSVSLADCTSEEVTQLFDLYSKYREEDGGELNLDGEDEDEI